MTASEEERFLPIGWISIPLGVLAVWGSGGTPRRSESHYFGGGIPWVTISDLNDGTVTKTVETVSQLGIKNSSAKIVEPGAVMIALYGSIGKLGIAGKKLATNQAIAYALPNERRFSNKYLFYVLQHKREELNKLGSGVTQKNIYLGDIKAFQVPIAPRDEQERIVQKLEELLSDLDAGIAELKAAQRKLELYRKSLLKAAVEGKLTAAWRERRKAEAEQASETSETCEQLLVRILAERRARWGSKQHSLSDEFFSKNWQKRYPEPSEVTREGLPELPTSWTWATIDQLSLEQRYGSSAKTSSAASGIPVIRMGNIQDGDLDLQDLKYLPKDHHEFPTLFLDDGDLLFNRTNSPELVGKTAVYRSQIRPCSYASYLIAVSLSKLVSPEIVAAYINSSYGRRWIKSVATQQVGQANVNGTKLSALAVPLPPFDEQIEIVNLLNKLGENTVRRNAELAQGLRIAATQRRNILKAAFTGRLLPQDPNDEPASVLLERICAERMDQAACGPARRRKAQEAA